ncbi:MAG TPA: DNA gyrase inhibitor YacG [Nitrospirae bacterium]|nr:DNA gyrase inhibitor YacG [Nitrospirota bacterium]
MKIKCPICNKITTWEENVYRPFCSERCKLNDLGKWITEDYKIVESIDKDKDMVLQKEQDKD